jgi:type II secretory pathway predicted ATPase ExeA
MNIALYISFFGFSAAPFAKEISDADLWLPPSKQEVVDGLCEAADERECALVLGDPGLGKTCVLRAVRRRLPQTEYRLTYCHNATLGKRDFYRQLCLAMGLSPSATAAAVFYAVSSHIQELGKERLHPVFFLDEAHLLHPETLDHLHILLNYEWDSRALLSLFLIGLPELLDRLALRRHRSMLSRIHRRFVVGPLTQDDTADYLRNRLRLAGCDRELFSLDTIVLLHDHAGGALRNIDRLATAALREAARKKRKTVDAETLQRVLDAEGKETTS